MTSERRAPGVEVVGASDLAAESAREPVLCAGGSPMGTRRRGGQLGNRKAPSRGGRRDTGGDCRSDGGRGRSLSRSGSQSPQDSPVRGSCPAVIADPRLLVPVAVPGATCKLSRAWAATANLTREPVIAAPVVPLPDRPAGELGTGGRSASDRRDGLRNTSSPAGLFLARVLARPGFLTVGRVNQPWER